MKKQGALYKIKIINFSFLLGRMYNLHLGNLQSVKYQRD